MRKRKAIPDTLVSGTSGVRDPGMYEELLWKLGRSALGRLARDVTFWQGVMSESEGKPDAEVRLSRSSEEVG